MRGREREIELSKGVYFSDSYFSYSQLWSFAEQIYHIREFRPASVLEIGIGNGFVSAFLRTMGVCVKTYDINPNLTPDIVAPVSDIETLVKPGEFDLISCCEVLEHLPFEEFDQTIGAFAHLSDRLFLTLPVHGKFFGFGGNLQLPRFRHWIKSWVKLPTKSKTLPEWHFWEVGYSKPTQVKNIVAILRNHYGTVDTGMFVANPYHRYFKCTVTEHRQNTKNVQGEMP